MSEIDMATVPEEPKGLVDILKAYKGSPSTDKIEKWKLEFGEVFVSGFSEDELFIWRPLQRHEWVKLQIAARTEGSQVDQFSFEELLCQACLLWSSLSEPFKKAGTVSTMQEQVLLHSNFLTSQAAQMLVAKL